MKAEEIIQNYLSQNEQFLIEEIHTLPNRIVECMQQYANEQCKEIQQRNVELSEDNLKLSMKINTLIGILDKKDERIKELEDELKDIRVALIACNNPNDKGIIESIENKLKQNK